MKHLVKYSLFYLLILVSCNKTVDVNNVPRDNTGQLRDLDSAKEWALQSIAFLGNASKAAGNERTIDSCEIIAKTKTESAEKDTLLYVFNFADNEGFSIISAKKDLEPILAVTESGHFTPDGSTTNKEFNFYLRGVIERLSERNNPHGQYYWYLYDYTGDSLSRDVGVQWGQGDIYGRFCSNSIAGCIPIALAQIMAYHEYPSSFMTTCSMSPYYGPDSTISLPWSQIKVHVKTHSELQTCYTVHKNIGALCREIGKQLSTVYYNNGPSSSDESMIPDALDYFGYSFSTPDTLNSNAIKNSLITYGPAYMGGEDINSGEGHAWVVDGYKDYIYSLRRYEMAGLGNTPIMTQQIILEEAHAFHFNWGWDGDCNGYFSFGVYDVEEADTYDGAHVYTGYDFSSLMSLINIIPPSI